MDILIHNNLDRINILTPSKEGLRMSKEVDFRECWEELTSFDKTEKGIEELLSFIKQHSETQ